MSPEKQIRAIAEHCGWTYFEIGPYDGSLFGMKPGPNPPVSKLRVPDYLADMNAIHAVVNALPPIERALFISRLNDVTRRQYPEAWLPERIVRSTAADWCEALLRMLGKWEES